MSHPRTLLKSCLLALPLVAFLLHHYVSHTPDLVPSGFTRDDNVVYIANARQNLDQGWSLTYANPFDASAEAPAIYSQPYNYILALLLSLGMDPGLTLSLFGITCAVFCIFYALRLLQHLYPDIRARGLFELLLIWGGGLTALGGIAINAVLHPSGPVGFWNVPH